MQIQDENMLSMNIGINDMDDKKNTSTNTKKKDDKEKQDKQKSNKRGLGSLLRKSTAKEEPNTEEHTELDTTQ